MNTNKKSIVQMIVIMLVVVNTAATAFLCVKIYRSDNTSGSEKYTLFVGLNDKETYKQEITTNEAKKIINNVCKKYVDGYTVQDAKGMWVDENGKDTHENTVVCYFNSTDNETIHKIADNLLTELNQNSILIEKNQIQNEFYSNSQK